MKVNQKILYWNMIPCLIQSYHDYVLFTGLPNCAFLCNAFFLLVSNALNSDNPIVTTFLFSVLNVTLNVIINNNENS